MGNVSGNYYKLRKQYENLKEDMRRLEAEILVLREDLDHERTKDHNQIITKLVRENGLLSKKLKVKDDYIQGLKDKCSRLIKLGYLHYDLSELLFDTEFEMGFIETLLTFGSDTPRERLSRKLWKRG